jgi:di/tricarboxylate transporter
MKAVGVVMVVGFILLYFVNAAFKVDIWQEEILIHSAIRFFAGFIAIGIWVFSKHRIRFMNVFYVVLALVLADDIWDYFRNINSFRPEAMLHSSYMLLWGALAGYVSARQLKNKREN